MTKSKCIRAASAVLVLSGIVSASAVAQASSADDATLTATVKEAIAQHPDLGPPNQIYIDSRDHVVYLSGFVDNGLIRADAEDVARKVPGVSHVVSVVSVEK